MNDSEKPRTGFSSVASRRLGRTADDHALDAIPTSERRSGWALLWNTAGVGSTLVVLSVGAAVTTIAGVGWGIVVGGVTAVLGGGLGWAVGHVCHVTGVSSTVTSRYYGLGSRGSALASLIFAFMIIGFLALENAMLYHGTLFLLGWAPTLLNAVCILGFLTIAWFIIPLFGIRLIEKTSGILTVVTGVLFVVVMTIAVSSSGRSLGAIFGTDPAPGGDYTGQLDRIQAAFAIIAGIAGALALVGADFARFARRTSDVGIMAVGGSIVVNLLVLIAGTVIFQAGSIVVGDRLSSDADLAATQPGATIEDKVAGMVSANPGAFFVVLAGLMGFALIYAAQAKAQAVNAYSASLSLTNLVDSAFRRNPGRVVMLVVANLLALLMIALGILNTIAGWLDALGIVTTSLCTLIIVDFFVVRRARPVEDLRAVQNYNVAGIVTLLGSSAIAQLLVVTNVTRLGFLVAIVMTAVIYPVLRWTVLPPDLHAWGRSRTRSNQPRGADTDRNILKAR